jgi:hypothetical protein
MGEVLFESGCLVLAIAPDPLRSDVNRRDAILRAVLPIRSQWNP